MRKCGGGGGEEEEEEDDDVSEEGGSQRSGENVRVRGRCWGRGGGRVGTSLCRFPEGCCRSFGGSMVGDVMAKLVGERW